MDPARHHTERRAHSSRTRASCGPSSAPANSRFCAAGPTCSHISGRPTSRAPASHARSRRDRARASFSARTGPALIWMAAAWNTSTSGLVINLNRLAARLDCTGAVWYAAADIFAVPAFRAGSGKWAQSARFFCFLRMEFQVGRKEEIVEKVRAIAEPLAAGEGLELVD